MLRLLLVSCNQEVTSTNLGNSLSAYGVTAVYIYDSPKKKRCTFTIPDPTWWWEPSALATGSPLNQQ